VTGRASGVLELGAAGSEQLVQTIHGTPYGRVTRGRRRRERLLGRVATRSPAGSSPLL
jgi:hypothetical protein